MSDKFLDYNGLDFFISLVSNDYISEDKLSEYIQRRSFTDWANIEDEIPKKGTILVYENRSTIDGKPVPDIKIANGVDTIKDLPFLVDRNVDSLIVNYINIVSNNEIELCLLGAVENSNEIKRNTLIKVKGGDLYAETLHGKLSNSLFIGEHEYNGSARVNIPIYKGE